MTRQPPASGLVLRQYDDKAYNVHDRATGERLGRVVAWWQRWEAYGVPNGRLGMARTRSDALRAGWPEKWPTRPAQPPGPVGGQLGEGDGPNAPQNRPCPYGDPTCPCPDVVAGRRDPCHYEGVDPMPPPPNAPQNDAQTGAA